MSTDLMADLSDSLVRAQAYTILSATERQLSDPAKWLQIDDALDCDSEATCVGLALYANATVDWANANHIPSLLLATNALLRAIGEPESLSYSSGVKKVYGWNDDPATTHADVMRVLAEAKELLS